MKYLKFVLIQAHGKGSQGGRSGEVLSGCFQIAVVLASGETRGLISVFGLVRIARQLTQLLFWIKTAMQSPLGKIPLVPDSRTRSWPMVRINLSLS